MKKDDSHNWNVCPALDFSLIVYDCYFSWFCLTFSPHSILDRCFWIVEETCDLVFLLQDAEIVEKFNFEWVEGFFFWVQFLNI